MKVSLIPLLVTGIHLLDSVSSEQQGNYHGLVSGSKDDIQHDSVSADDVQFWNRFLYTQDSSFSFEPAMFEPSPGPTIVPSLSPTFQPSNDPSLGPSLLPTALPSERPIVLPSIDPSVRPTPVPSNAPITKPSNEPTGMPSTKPTNIPSSDPTSEPSVDPSKLPSKAPSTFPSPIPSTEPTKLPIKPPFAKTTVTPTKIDATESNNCYVQVDINCYQTINGKPCDYLSLQNTKRCPLSSQEFTFQYDPTPCNDQSAGCEDFGLLSKNILGNVRCTDGSSTELVVEPTAISPGTFFSVSLMNAGNRVQNIVQCLITNKPGMDDAQMITLDVTSALTLTDVFGSLRLVSCDNQSCLTEIHHQIKVTNIGTTELEVTNVTVSSSHDGMNDVELVPDYPVVAENFITFDKSSMINVCNAEEYTMEINVESNPIQGDNTCNAQANSTISVTSECMVNLNVQCTVDNSDEMDCSNLPQVAVSECVCTTCTNQLIFQYTGSSCIDQPADSAGFNNCTDSGPQNINSSSTDAYIVVTGDDSLFFTGKVSVGDNIVIDGGCGCIGNAINVVIIPILETEGNSQNIQIDTSCTDGSGLQLLDMFGALKFIGYTCLGGKEQNCFIDATYDVTAENLGDVDFVLGNLTLSINGLTKNIVQDVNIEELVVPVGMKYSLEEKVTFMVCNDLPITTTTNVYGFAKGTNLICNDANEDSFSMASIESSTPSEWPSTIPSSIPSLEDVQVITPSYSMMSSNSKYSRPSMASSSKYNSPSSSEGKGGKGGDTGKGTSSSSFVRAPTYKYSGKGNDSIASDASVNSNPSSGKGNEPTISNGKGLVNSPINVSVNRDQSSGKGKGGKGKGGKGKGGKGSGSNNESVNGNIITNNCPDESKSNVSVKSNSSRGKGKGSGVSKSSVLVNVNVSHGKGSGVSKNN